MQKNLRNVSNIPNKIFKWTAWSILVVFKKDLTTYTNGFKLPSDMPTTAQLIQTETGGFPEGFADYTKGYKIYIYFPNKVSFPGYADPIKKLCLGCEDPDTPTALQEHPVFISN